MSTSQFTSTSTDPLTDFIFGHIYSYMSLANELRFRTKAKPYVNQAACVDQGRFIKMATVQVHSSHYKFFHKFIHRLIYSYIA